MRQRVFFNYLRGYVTVIEPLTTSAKLNEYQVLIITEPIFDDKGKYTYENKSHTFVFFRKNLELLRNFKCKDFVIVEYKIKQKLNGDKAELFNIGLKIEKSILFKELKKTELFRKMYLRF